LGKLEQITLQQQQKCPGRQRNKNNGPRSKRGAILYSCAHKDAGNQNGRNIWQECGKTKNEIRDCRIMTLAGRPEMQAEDQHISQQRADDPETIHVPDANKLQ